MRSNITKDRFRKLKNFALERRTRSCARLSDEKGGKDGPMGSECASPIKPSKPILNALEAFARQLPQHELFLEQGELRKPHLGPHGR